MGFSSALSSSFTANCCCNAVVNNAELLGVSVIAPSLHSVNAAAAVPNSLHTLWPFRREETNCGTGK